MKKKLYWTIAMIGVALMTISITNQRTGKNIGHFTGPVLPDEPLSAALIAALEGYVTVAMQAHEVPGVSMVLVQGDRVIYANGLGVRDLQTKKPVTTETLMGIGSATKSMTAIMMGSLVDEGIIEWDTSIIDILPSFALSDPEITKATTFQHTLCMCTGGPRRIEELTFKYSELGPEDIIESLATIPLHGEFQQDFNYSSRMLAAGGYISSMAAGGNYGDLAQAYTDIMQDRIFDPVHMTSSTFSIQQAVASGNYATPYYSTLSGYEAIPIELEEIFKPIAPAAALWSNANDLGQYLLILLNEGITSDGTQIISAENLAYLWEPHVAIDEQVSYGLGWQVEDYHGLTILHHPGGTVGFSSELVVIPEYNLGFALLTNCLDMVAPIGKMATYRLLEMLTGREQVYDREVNQTVQDVSRQVAALSLVTEKNVDPSEIAFYLGRYQNNILGEVALVLHEDHSLWVDVGEYEIPIRSLKLEENQYIIYSSIFVGKPLVLSIDVDGQPTLTIKGDEGVYQFTAVTDVTSLES